MFRIVRITGSGFVKQGSVMPGHPVEFRHWKDVVDECDFALESAVSSEEEEAVVELWLEDPQSFMIDEEGAAVKTSSMRRVTGGMGLMRHGDIHQKQASSNFDKDLEDMKNHVTSVLANMGATSWEKQSK